ncbi:MAG: RNA polymerase sigma factor [Thermoanaerobaculia bacterium]
MNEEEARFADDRSQVSRYLASREEQAFRELYRAHTPYLWRLALRLCGGRESEAEEIVQETWIRVSTLLERFSWKSALRTWMAGILVNCWRESRKRLRLAEALPDQLEDEATLPPGIELLDLERALAELPEASRAVVVLFEIEGYSHDEIGRLLGIPPGTSKSRLHHGRRALHGTLTAEGAIR